jgi:4-hydroxybenzoate polyprenyltransferase
MIPAARVMEPQVAVTTPRLVHRLAEEIAFLVKAARPGFWLTSIWFYLVPVGGRQVLDQPEFWLGLLYVSFPLGLLIYGWNDVVDFDVDRFNPRKGTYLFGARGTPERLARLPWRMALVQVPFAILFTLLLGPKALAWFAALIVATAVYNCPPFAFKGRPGFDVLNQAGYLLVFVLASWLNHVSQVPWFTFLFGAMFAMHSHLFGEIMDLEPDRRAGRRTLAGVLHARPAKWLLVAFLAAEAVLIWTSTRDPWLAVFLAASAAWFVVDVLLLWGDRPYSAAEMRFLFLAWNAVALASMPWMWHAAALAAR